MKKLIPWFYRGHEHVLVLHVVWAAGLIVWGYWLVQQYMALGK